MLRSTINEAAKQLLAPPGLPGGARRSQEGPGGARRGQEEPGVGSQEGPGGQGGPGGAREEPGGGGGRDFKGARALGKQQHNVPPAGKRSLARLE